MKLDINEIAEKIGVPSDKWAGRCHEISHLLLPLLGSFGGPNTTYRLVRGHWVGPVNADSFFGHRNNFPFIQHSWIQVEGLDYVVPEAPLIKIDQPISPTIKVTRNPIIDPTRFAFEGVEPYIYIGGSDHYDPGGNQWRAVTMGVPPTLFPRDRMTTLNLKADTRVWLLDLTEDYGHTGEDGRYSVTLCMWLANLPLQKLGIYARDIFEALIETGLAGFIPIDNRHIVLGR